MFILGIICLIFFMIINIYDIIQEINGEDEENEEQDWTADPVDNGSL